MVFGTSSDLRTPMPRIGAQLTALRETHLPQALGQSAALRWPYREADWRFAFDLGHGFAAEADGRLVATAMWWPFGPAHASAGMIIVDAKMQGQGLGRALMEHLLDAACDRTVLLNATREGLPLYARFGFAARGRVFQHQAVLTGEVPLAHAPAPAGVRSMHAADAAKVRQLDLAATGMDRTALLDALLRVGTTVVLDRGTGASAYACMREFGRGLVIGPVVAAGADAAADATDLVVVLARSARGRFVRIDVTEAGGLSTWLEKSGLPCVDHAVGMVREASSRSLDTDAQARLFALSNQSFG